MYLSIIQALADIDQGLSVKEKRKVWHRAKEYMVDEGRLWRVADGRTSRAIARLECVTQKEMTELARRLHEENGHFKEIR